MTHNWRTQLHKAINNKLRQQQQQQQKAANDQRKVEQKLQAISTWTESHTNPARKLVFVHCKNNNKQQKQKTEKSKKKKSV